MEIENSVIEPLLTEQWFVDAKKLSKEAIKKLKKKTSFSQIIEKDLFSMDGKHRTMVYLSSTMVGSSNSSMVYRRWSNYSCRIIIKILRKLQRKNLKKLF